MLDSNQCCSAHCKWRFICDADQSWDSFFVAGAVFGEVGVSLFVAGAAFGDILGDSRSAKCCIFEYKIVFKVGRVRSPKRRVRDAIFWSDYVRIMFGLSSDYRRIIVESSFYWRKQFTEFPLKSWTYRFRGRRSIWWGWWLTVLAPRIVNDVSCVTRINHEIHFAWQAQYLLRLEVDFACSAHWKWRFIWDADQSWDSFCVAGAVFIGEVGVWLFVAGAAFGDILGDSRSAKCRIFQYKIVFKVGRVRSPKRRVRDAIFWSDYVRIMFGLSSDYRRIIVESSFYWRKQFTEFPLKSWTYRFRGRRSIWWGWWLTVLAPRIVNDVSCVTRINHGIHFVWQAQFAEVGGWLCLLCALEMTFHMRRGSIMRFILRGRRSIWWSWSVTFRGRRSIWWHFGSFGR